MRKRSTGSYCEWMGVVCLTAYNGTSLYVQGLFIGMPLNNVQGQIPNSMAYLQTLNLIDLSNNLIESLPQFGIVPMPLLARIIMSNNSIRSIPSEFSSTLPPLLELHRLLTCLSPVGHLDNLFMLQLSYNPLATQLPEWLFNMKSLNSLQMRRCELNGTLPDAVTFHNLTLLVRLLRLRWMTPI